MPNEFSFISCSALIRYPKDHLKDKNLTVCGEINVDCLARLRKHLSNCEAMETRDLNYLVGILDENLK